MIVRDKKNIEEIRILISEGKIDAVFESLLLLVRDQRVRDQIYLLSGDWQDTQSKYNGGLLTFSEYKSHRNRIVLGFFENILPSLEGNKIKEKADQLLGAGFDKYNNEDFEGAIIDFEAVLHLFPNDTEALLYRGIVRNRLERYREALSDFNEVINKERFNAHALVCRGSLYKTLEENEKACIDWMMAKECAFEKSMQEMIEELLRNYCSQTSFHK